METTPRIPYPPPVLPRHAISIGAIVFVSMLPVTMLVPPLKELVAVRFQSGEFAAHLFMSINMLGAVVASPLISALADRLGARKRVAMAALVIDGCCLAAMSFTPTLAMLMVARLFEGIAHLLALSTLMAIAAAGAPEGRRGRTMGLIGACMMLGTGMGTQLGGAVWKLSGTWMFVIAGCVSILAAMCAALIVREPTATDAEGDSKRGTIALIREYPRLTLAYAFAFVDRFCVGVIITTFVLFLADVHHFDPAGRSFLLGLCFMIPFALCVYPAGRLIDRTGRIWPIVLSSAAFGSLFAAYGYVPRELMWAAMLASGLLSAVMFAPNLALCVDLAPQNQRGAALTGFNAAGSLGFVIGPLAGGAMHAMLKRHVTDLSAYRLTLASAGATVFLCALATLPMLLRLKRQGVIR